MAEGRWHPQPGVDYPRNWHELLVWFPDDAACVRYLERLRWGAGFACRFCGAADAPWWQMGDGLRRCGSCRAESSVTAGTIFARTRLPLVTWFAAVWYVVNQKQGVSALGLQRVLGIGSYQTAWAWLHKLRRAMVRPGRDRLAGELEVDETFVGGTDASKPGRSAGGKAIVAIAVEALPRGRCGRVRLARVADTSEPVLSEFVGQAAEPGSVVYTDSWAGYLGLAGAGFRHQPTSLRASGDPAHVAMPRAHRIASLLKRWLLGTHQGAVSAGQLDYYLDEFTFRFNRRHSRHRGLLFYRLLEQAVATDPHPYTTLRAQAGESPA
jgi:transposase-like protein